MLNRKPANHLVGEAATRDVLAFQMINKLLKIVVALVLKVCYAQPVYTHRTHEKDLRSWNQ